MDNPIAKLLGGNTLPPEMLASLQEAFEQKIEESRAATEVSMRQEFSRRYEHDKSNLVEAMDRMLTDVVTKHAVQTEAATAKFVEARDAFRKAVKESRAKYSTKLTENLSESRKFVAERLSTEIRKLREQQKALTTERLKTADLLESAKSQMLTEQTQRLAKIDSFVVRQVEKELKEFQIDHNALVETRVKLVSESRKKLRETQARFVKEAARNVEAVITKSITNEMAQLHEDLERNRQNMFGRRIFEAVAAEYMTSYLQEGTEIRKLQNVLEAKEKALDAATSKLDEAVKEGQTASRKAKLAEDRAARSKVLGELLSNLRGEKRVVMEGMLETVRTDALRTTFNKLLPVVLDENARKSTAPVKKSLVENDTARRSTVITGDQRSNRIFESRAENNEFDSEVAQVVRLAGLSK